MQSQETPRKNTIGEKLSQFPFHELRNVPAKLLLTSQKRLEVLGHHLVEHGMVEVTRTVGVEPIKTRLARCHRSEPSCGRQQGP